MTIATMMHNSLQHQPTGLCPYKGNLYCHLCFYYLYYTRYSIAARIDLAMLFYVRVYRNFWCQRYVHEGA